MHMCVQCTHRTPPQNALVHTRGRRGGTPPRPARGAAEGGSAEVSLFSVSVSYGNRKLLGTGRRWREGEMQLQGGGAGRAGRSGEGLPPWELNGHLLGSPADVLPMPKGHSSAHFRGGTPPRMRGGRWDPTLLTVPLVPGAESFCLGGGAPTTLQESVPSQKALEARSGGPQRNGIPLPMPSGSATPLLRPQCYAVGRTGWEG